MRFIAVHINHIYYLLQNKIWTFPGHFDNQMNQKWSCSLESLGSGDQVYRTFMCLHAIVIELPTHMEMQQLPNGNN